MDFLMNLHIDFGNFSGGTVLMILGFAALLLYAIVTVSLVYHWWKYTFFGDVLVLPMAIAYAIGSVALLLVIISSLGL